MRPLRVLVVGVLAAASLTSCSSAPAPFPEDRRDMVLVVVADDGLQPSTDIRIQAGGSVGWLHEADPSARVEIDISYPHTACEACATTMEFELVETNTKTKRALTHSQLAALSFLNPGTIDYSVFVDGNSYRGRIVVGPREE